MRAFQSLAARYARITAMRPAVSKMNYDQLRLLPDDRQRHELVDGELLMTPSPNTRHQRVLNKINLALTAHAIQHGLGEVFIAPYDVVFEDHTVLQPDILFVSAQRAGVVGEDAIHGAPDLVVEVLSPSSFYNDLRIKMNVYGRFGVQEYWVVDPEKETIEVYRLAGAKLELTRQFSADSAFESPLFPNLALTIKSVFS
jgi:Uma2 family endonuclease